MAYPRFCDTCEQVTHWRDVTHIYQNRILLHTKICVGCGHSLNEQMKNRKERRQIKERYATQKATL